MKKTLLSVAGFDPTSGAGASLDLRVFQHLGFHGMSVLTSLTAQNTEKVNGFHCLPHEFLKSQYEALRGDVFISGIKVGMVGCGENMPIIQEILKDNLAVQRVVDPVLKSSSGTWLIDQEAIPNYISSLKGNASLLTPNREEAGMLSGMKVRTEEEMKKAAEKIYALSSIPCLITGGDLPKKSTNLLYDGKSFYHFKKEKLKKKVHGTGCCLSSSLLAFLVQGNSLEKACHLATEFTHKAIQNALQVGRGQHIISL
ncbi:MAG: bifunctional hydroxymethylpyrimidine kinase/phosphomethylpyrimidine kinase [Candidatus Aminicenantes bacterium]|nr:MAG: bifunctional hydroxymethylpyrimidine kinase/phosphomethylpyrimidine kinase [Candidatus Aminicenantes bacterium]